MTGALHGIKIVDVTSNVAGPFASHILASLGADVIKIERPVQGDDTRRWGPPFWGGHGLTFLDLNRSKRSCVLDLKDAGERAHLLELVEEADVFLQNLRPGSLDKLGLGAEQLTAAFPRLVYAEISGFGFTGPLRDEPAFDPLMQAFSGLMSITGHDDTAPARIPVSMLDKGSGMWSALGIMAALRQRDESGVGSVVRTSLLETAFGFQSVQAMSYLVSGESPGRLGSGTVGIVPYEAFPAMDGYVVIAAGNDRLFRSTCAALGVHALAADPRFDTNPDRVGHRAELVQIISALTRQLTVLQLTERLIENGVPNSPVNDIGQAVEHPQILAMKLFQPVEGLEPDGVVAMRLPVTFDGDLSAGHSSPPALKTEVDAP